MNRSPRIPLLACALLLAASASSRAEDEDRSPRGLVKGIAANFENFDSDGDGRISEDELPLGDLFRLLDADKDGFLLQAELLKFVDAGRSKPDGGEKSGGEGKDGKGMPDVEETFLDRARRIIATDPRFNVAARRDDFLRNFDRDPKDGKIQRAEYPGADGDRNFRRQDRDRNGILDERELVALMREQITDLAKSRRHPDRSNFMYLFDLDMDRRVTKEEYALLRGPASTFNSYDVEVDGVVTDDEVRYPERYRDGKGGGREAAGQEAENRTLWDLYDKNGDRRVTLEEFGGGEAVFRRLDRNRDGVLTPADG